MAKATTNCPVRKMLKTLSKIVQESGLSYQEIANRAVAKGYETTPYKVRYVCNGKFEENKMVPSLDSYISVVLDVLGMNDVELIRRTSDVVRRKESPEVHTILGHLKPEVRMFVNNPDNTEYIDYAYKLYKQAQATKELEAIQKELLGKTK